VLRLTDQWVWDFWLADDGRDYHAFFLSALRTPDDPDGRHRRARIGHAVSPDLREWERLPDALDADPQPGFDDLTTWTGSVLQHPDGSWLMYYTGVTEVGGELIQRVGAAQSQDLTTWHRHPGNPIVSADRRWYELYGDPGANGEEWRDPWVIADPGGDGWHMFITARAAEGAVDDRGVIGHARSHDLLTWEVLPPLSSPGNGFAHLEVPQVETIDGRPVLVFSCLRDKFSADRLAREGTGGVWAAPGESLLGPFDIAAAHPVTDHRLYSGRLVQERSGGWALLAFHAVDEAGRFPGHISDPLPVGWDDQGTLAVVEGPAATVRVAPLQ
jgi:beta-fructofuranosidase